MPGPAGPRGNYWFTGSGAPANATLTPGGVTPITGDLYLDTSGCGVYQYGASAWGGSPIVTLNCTSTN